MKSYSVRIKNGRGAAQYACEACGRPMKLVSNVSQHGGLPELLIFFCTGCDQTDRFDAVEKVPSMWP